jgi:DNA modification methylase
MNYFIYNKSSEKMSEWKSNSVNLIITSPPYNIGTTYGNNKDKVTFHDYEKMLNRVFSECYRVLENDGKIVIEVADSILIDKNYVQLANMVQNICLKLGYFICERHINFVKSEHGVLAPDHDWNNNFYTSNNSHSNCHHWLVFTKTKTKFNNGKIFYLDYKESKEHPCPFPAEICKTILDMYFKKGFTVLDPFMGTATIGIDVISRGGIFGGFEIDTDIYNTAEKKLKTAIIN